MRTEHLNETITGLKRQGRVITNIFPGCVEDGAELTGVESDRSVVCWAAERFRMRAFYATIDVDDLIGLMGEIPKGVVTEQLYRKEGENPQKDIAERAGFEKLATYIRISTTFKSNPYDIPEVGRRAILNEYYDPAFGEYAGPEDIEELFQLQKTIFDEKKEDVFTKEEWEDIIKNNNCMLYREDGEIVTYYVYRREGVKLYGNISYNRGPANYLYNIERRVFTKMWEDGVRESYAWYDMKNTKALIRRNDAAREAVTHQSFLYNDIWEKQ